MMEDTSVRDESKDVNEVPFVVVSRSRQGKSLAWGHVLDGELMEMAPL